MSGRRPRGKDALTQRAIARGIAAAKISGLLTSSADISEPLPADAPAKPVKIANEATQIADPTPLAGDIANVTPMVAEIGTRAVA
jgi:hypothetical protein